MIRQLRQTKEAPDGLLHRGESLTTLDSRSGPNALDGPYAQTNVASQTKLGFPGSDP